jgi:hypothetical protein
MKFYSLIILFAATTLITACSTKKTDPNSVESTDDESLSGTWLAVSNATYFDLNDVKTGTTTTYSFAYITENPTEVLFNTCHNHYDPSVLPIIHSRKDDQLQDIGNFYEPFTIINNQALTRTSTQPLSESSVLYEDTYAKINTAAIPTGVALNINGPVTASSTTETCIIQTLNSDSESSSYEILMPLDNETMSLSISTTQPLTIGSYVYDIKERGNSPILYDFFISSFDNNFTNIVGSNYLTPDVATLNITKSDSDLIKGSYSFTSLSGDNYNGNFSFIPYITN